MNDFEDTDFSFLGNVAFADAPAKTKSGKGKGKEREFLGITFSITHQTTDETRAKISASNKGKIRTAEQRARISASRIGGKPWNLGGKHSPESIAKMYEVKKKQCKAIMTPVGVLPSIRAAIKEFGWTSDGPVYYHMKRNPTEWYYMEK